MRETFLISTTIAAVCLAAFDSAADETADARRSRKLSNSATTRSLPRLLMEPNLSDGRKLFDSPHAPFVPTHDEPESPAKVKPESPNWEENFPRLKSSWDPTHLLLQLREPKVTRLRPDEVMDKLRDWYDGPSPFAGIVTSLETRGRLGLFVIVTADLKVGNEFDVYRPGGIYPLTRVVVREIEAGSVIAEPITLSVRGELQLGDRLQRSAPAAK